MKITKPNITGGEWLVAECNDSFYPNGKRISIHCDKAIMVAPKYYYTDNEFDANAKAISAVPDMIDALIATHTFMIKHGWKNIQECKQVENALTKAGCTYEP